jgi:ribosome-associated toxin RatA of RatAB toxin-antitoxin module
MKINLPQKYYQLFAVFWLSVVLTIAVSFVGMGQFSRIHHISAQEKQQISLREDQIIVTGNQGQYTGKLLIKAPVKTVWSVLTDYNNFNRFLPNVISSKIVENYGNKKVFEQVNLIQALFFSKQIRFRIATTENYPQQISFREVGGEVKSLEGVWRLKVISNQVLIEHDVNIDLGSGAERQLFFMIYPDNLATNLEAIKREIKRRN